MESILVTGGSGFIGSNFIRYMFRTADFRGIVVNLDKLTYAGNPSNTADIEASFGGSRYFFEHGDICRNDAVATIIGRYQIDRIVHFAAESHVDRSIYGPGNFIETNVNGTFSLLEAARSHWSGRKDVLFQHISTDEVYGSLGDKGYFYEDTPYAPRSVYSASKASSDHLVRSYCHTYGMPAVVSICSNNYGPFQFPEKLIPHMITNMLEGRQLPVYGDGKHIRDWLFVEDHCSALHAIMQRGQPGRTYNIGGDNEWENFALVRKLCRIVARYMDMPDDHYYGLITHVADRPGHDRRYAINCDRIKRELGWSRSVSFDDGLERTVEWYLANRAWIDDVKSGEYQKWIAVNYGTRT